MQKQKLVELNMLVLFIGTFVSSCSQMANQQNLPKVKMQIMQKKLSASGGEEFVMCQRQCPEVSGKSRVVDRQLFQINYPSGESKLGEKNRDFLQQNLHLIKNKKVHLVAFTDHVGSYQVNQTLSVSRVNNIKRYLMEQGLSAEDLSGEFRPKCCYLNGNQTPAQMQVNRRVEFSIEDNWEDS